SSYQRYDGLLYDTRQPIDTYYPNYPLQAGFDGVSQPIQVQWARILTSPPFGSSPSVRINGSLQPQNISEPGTTIGKVIIHINYPSYIDINNNLVASGVTYFATNSTYGMINIAVINLYHNPFSEEINVSKPIQSVWVNLTNSSGVVGNYYPWIPIGPYGYLNPSEDLIDGSLTQITQKASGHIGQIAIDYSNPDIIYVASGNGPSYSGPLADGGIFKTVDDGVNWQPVDYGLPYSRTSALFMDQQNPNILVAGMLQMGIYRTTDGGGYWYKVSDFGNVTDIFEINGTLYASSSSGVIESVDMGESWTLLYRTAAPVEAFNISKDVMYAVLDNRELLKSTDLGLSWQEVYDFANISYDVWSIEASPFNPNDVFVFLGTFSNVPSSVWHSTDGGLNFTPFFNASNSKMVKFDPENGSIIYAIGPAYQATSFDGGKTFVNGGQVTDNMNIVVDPLNPSLAVIGSDQGVYETFDYGMHWKSINGNLNDSLTYGVAVGPNGSLIIADMQDYSAFISHNGGKTWIGGNEPPIPMGGEGTFFWINQFNGSWVYAVSQGGNLEISNDSGINFHNEGTIMGPSNYNWIDGQELYTDPINHSREFFGTNSGIYNLTEWGATYNLWGNSPSNVTAITSSSNSKIFFIGTTDGLYLYKDDKWIRASGINYPVGSIAVDPRNNSIVVVSLSGFYSFNGIYLSTDGGMNFSQENSSLYKHLYNLIPPYNDYPVLVSFLNISGEPLIATTANGLFLSTDLGHEWNPINYNLLSGQTTYSTFVNGTLYISTYGQGILKYPNFNVSLLPATVNGNFTGMKNLSVTINGKQVSTYEGHFTDYLPPGTYSINVTSSEFNKTYLFKLNPMETVNLTPGQMFNVTFTESGLPKGTLWGITLNGTTKNSTTDLISFLEPNGSYTFSVLTVYGYKASPASGSIMVNGTDVHESITFAQVKYMVTFIESGLPFGMRWYVNLSNGQSFSSTTNTITFNEPNG
ncbi:MAG: hypothetical protein QW578_08135, partial [Thermoplasmatales archaeon]